MPNTETICPPLTAPDNGDIDCSLGDNGEANPGETCTYSCNTGLGVVGDVSRTCQTDGRWTGRRPSCGRGESYCSNVLECICSRDQSEIKPAHIIKTL